MKSCPGDANLTLEDSPQLHLYVTIPAVSHEGSVLETSEYLCTWASVSGGVVVSGGAVVSFDVVWGGFTVVDVVSAVVSGGTVVSEDTVVSSFVVSMEISLSSVRTVVS